MNMQFLKNPIVLAILMAAITYAYLWWDNEKKVKDNPKVEKRPVSIVTPAAVGVLVWFIASSYFDKTATDGSVNVEGEVADSMARYQINTSSKAPSSKSYYLVGKDNVKLPATDVFIDLVPFD